MESIGERINRARKIKGWSQEELADLSTINIRTIQRIENNESVPRGKTLNLICNALNLDIKDFDLSNDSNKPSIVNLITNGFFLIILNFVLMSVYGYLTLDSESNINSKFGGILLSFFIPIFIVYKTMNMNNIERLLKFGSGFVLYIILVWVKHGFPTGFKTGLFPCLIIALGVLFYGNNIIKPITQK